MDKLVKPAIILAALLIGAGIFFRYAIQHSEPEHIEQKKDAAKPDLFYLVSEKAKNPISFKGILLNQNGAEAAIFKLCAEHPLNSQGKGISINCSQKKLYDDSSEADEIPNGKPKGFKFYVDYAMFTNAVATFSVYKDKIAYIHVDVTDGLDESDMQKGKYNIHTVVEVFNRIYGIYLQSPNNLWFVDEQGNDLRFELFIFPTKYNETVRNINISTPVLQQAGKAETEARRLYLDKVAKEVSKKL